MRQSELDVHSSPSPMNPIRTLVVDDEQPAQARLLELLGRERDISIVGVASDGREAMELIQTTAPHLLFLDIQMPDVDGFEVIQQTAPEQRPVTVFVTAYDKYAIQAFEAHALDYLLKPFSDERFEAALARACQLVRAQPTTDLGVRLTNLLEERAGVSDRSGYLERVVVKSGGRLTFVDINDVDWIEASDVYVHLHVGSTTHLYRSSVANLLQRLDPRRFVRIHRSAAVNTSRIKALQPRSHGDYTVILKNGVKLNMSRGYRPHLEFWLKQAL